MNCASADQKLKIEKVKSYINLIRKNFECPICIDFFDTPVITNCKHAFCKKCIESFIGEKRLPSCPLCKQTIKLRSLKKFESLETWVLKAKNLTESFDIDLGIVKAESREIENIKPKALNIDTSSCSMQSQKRKRSPSDEFKKEPTKESKKKKTPDTSSTDLDSTLSRSARGLRANSKKKKPLEEVDKNKTTSITAKNKVEHWLNATNGQTANTTLNFNEKESVANLLKKPCLSTFNINNQSHDLNSLLTLEGSSATSSKAISSAELDLKSGNNHNNNNNTKHSKKLVNKQLESTKLDNSLAFQNPPTPVVEAGVSKLDCTKASSSARLSNFATKILMKNFTSKHAPTPNAKLAKICQLNDTFAPPIEPPVMKIDDTICIENLVVLKERKPIKFYYRGSTRKGLQLSCSETMTSTLMNIIANQSDKKKIAKTVEGATNTPEAVFENAATQTTDTDEENRIQESFKLNLIEKKLFDFIYNEIETELVEDFIQTETAFVESQKIIPESPKFIPDTCVMELAKPVNHAPTEPIRQPVNEVDRFRELLETSISFENMGTDKRNKKLLFKRGRIPTLEFFNNNDESISQKPHVQSNTVLKELKLNTNTENLNETCYSSSESSEGELKKKFLVKNNLIVVDTPVKDDDESRGLKELNKTLSKSASRMELINSRFLMDNSTIRYDNSFNMSKSTRMDETSMFNTKTNIDETTFDADETNKENINQKYKADMQKSILANESNQMPQNNTLITEKDAQQLLNNVDEEEAEPVFKMPTQGVKPAVEVVPKVNHSFYMDSLNVTENHANFMPPILSLSTTYTTDVNQTAKQANYANKVPPNAADILGVSYASDSISTTCLEATNPQPPQVVNVDQNQINPTSDVSEKAVFKMPASNFNNKKEEETQLLTDSELNVIDNLCKDMYSTHNQTINEGSSLNRSERTRKPNENNKIEFVCSLLKPDMKDLLKRFAKFLKANVADDVTETTTHLVVDSDQNFVCGVTSKYLKAISRKIWIVSYLWILKCVKENQFLEPTAYEIKGDGIFGVHEGPKNARLSTTDLFGTFEFLFIGKFETDSISLDEMIKLATKNGAKIVRKAKDFSDNKIRIVLFDEKLHRLSVKNANFMLESAKIFSVTSSWLLDSLACYSLRDMKLYALYQED